MNKNRLFECVYEDQRKILNDPGKALRLFSLVIKYEEYLKNKKKLAARTIQKHSGAIFEFDILKMLLKVKWVNIIDKDLEIYRLVLVQLKYNYEEIKRRIFYIKSFVDYCRRNKIEF